MKTKYFVGIDISSEFFTVSCYIQKPGKYISFGNYENSENGFKKLVKDISEIDTNKNLFLFCMESTGVYGESLTHFLFDYGFTVIVENALKVKRAFGISGKKSDEIDSMKIAEYSFRFQDIVKPWAPKPEIVEKIKVLLAQRDLLTKQKIAHMNSMKALKRKYLDFPDVIANYKDMISYSSKQIKSIEKMIMELIKQSPDHYQTVSNITSIPGIGNILTFYLFVTTNGFSENLNYKNIASYLGIVPQIYQSGKSVHKRSSSSGMGPGEIRKILYLASMTAMVHNKNLKMYFLRKVAEGKPKMLVLNNIGNKLLKLIIAIIKSGGRYSENFRSINPALVF